MCRQLRYIITDLYYREQYRRYCDLGGLCIVFDNLLLEHPDMIKIINEWRGNRFPDYEPNRRNEELHYVTVVPHQDIRATGIYELHLTVWDYANHAYINVPHRIFMEIYRKVTKRT